MKMLLVGAVGALILAALLSSWLWLARDNLIILSLDRGPGRRWCDDGDGLRGGVRQGDPGQGSSQR